VPKKLTEDRTDEHCTVRKPWQSWGTTIRYLITRVAQAVPTAMLVWLAHLHH
jgi:hypothetical protein